MHISNLLFNTTHYDKPTKTVAFSQKDYIKQCQSYVLKIQQARWLKWKDMKRKERSIDSLG